MENFDKELAQYGILAKNGKIFLEGNKITIIDTEIKEIKFQKLQEAGIKEICISRSEIKYLYFLEKNTIKTDFRNCNFKNQIIARELYFKNEVIFHQCVFDTVVDFSKTKFDSRVDFSLSVFKGEVRFIGTQFQAEQSNNEIIENDFREVIFEGRASFFNATFKAGVSFEKSQFKEETRFIGTQFLAEKDSNKIIENDFRETIFEREVSFDNVIFLTGVIFAFSQFKNEVRLSISNFLYAKNINFIDIVFGKLVLQKELFEKSVNFERCIFLQDVNFKDYTFNEITFNTCIFKGNAYFNNSNFTKGVDFHESEFEKTACFYGVNFDETPNFSQALFKSNINIINSNLNFDFTKLDKEIRLLSSQGEGKYDYEIANDFRDSFRNFKSALIKDNNFLDASNFHKYELYCKEIELENKKDKTLKDRIDKWQLFFYRKLCDHHTDLLLNLRWLVVAIGLFALLYFASRVIQDINLLKVLNQYGVCLSMIGVFNLFCLYWFECIKKFDFFVCLNLIVVLWVICYMPKIIFGIVNIIGGKSYNGFENALITIYTILLALVLFSLQKTARKNSIVPS
ncbi:pentapeptide repeat-containing protein [Campylobacter coli]|nr:pentapeptide repeat-containing protein [Campylobacter coli]